MLPRLWLLCGIIRREFNAPLLGGMMLVLYPLYWSWISLGLLLDRALYRRRDDDAETLLIAGPPRSGTTFLHRYLAENSGGAASPLWESLVPSLCWQRLLRPLVQRAVARGRPKLSLGAAHTARLDLPETDDLSVFARYLDSFFFYVYALSWHRDEFPAYTDPTGRPAVIAPRDLRWLNRAAERNRRRDGVPLALLKSFSAGFALPAVLEQVTGSKVIYVSRAAHETLPSSLSMVRAVLEVRGLYGRTEEASRQRHVERVVRASLAMQLAAIADLQALPADDVLLVRYEDLTGNFAATIERIFHFAGIAINDRLRDSITQRAAAQKSRRSEHRYSLEEFGLSETHIRRQFADVYAFFGHA